MASSILHRLRKKADGRVPRTDAVSGEYTDFDRGCHKLSLQNETKVERERGRELQRSLYFHFSEMSNRMSFVNELARGAHWEDFLGDWDLGSCGGAFHRLILPREELKK